MRVLVICNDFWHPASVPEQGLAALGNAGFEFDYMEAINDWSVGQMAGYPLVLLTRSNTNTPTDLTNWASDEAQEAFKNYVRKGNGLLVVHSGLAGYQKSLILRGIMGGTFIQHPPQCLVTIQPEEGHLMTKNASSFTVMDEHYFVDLDDKEANVFLSTTSEHGAQVGGWTRAEGDGRVCAISPGHNLEVWLHPSFQALLLNGLRWCAR